MFFIGGRLPTLIEFGNPLLGAFLLKKVFYFSKVPIEISFFLNPLMSSICTVPDFGNIFFLTAWTLSPRHDSYSITFLQLDLEDESSLDVPDSDEKSLAMKLSFCFSLSNASIVFYSVFENLPLALIQCVFTDLEEPL